MWQLPRAIRVAEVSTNEAHGLAAVYTLVHVLVHRVVRLSNRERARVRVLEAREKLHQRWGDLRGVTSGIAEGG